jgi:hypothetical protein
MDYKRLRRENPYWESVHQQNIQPTTQGQASTRKYKGRTKFYSKYADHTNYKSADSAKKGFLSGIFAKLMIALYKLKNSISKTKNSVNPYNQPGNTRKARFGKDSNFSNSGI